MQSTLATTIDELLDELAFENPAPEEKWFTRDNFDPMHRMEDLRRAASMGLIELAVEEPKETSRFRLTPLARSKLALGMASGE